MPPSPDHESRAPTTDRWRSDGSWAGHITALGHDGSQWAAEVAYTALYDDAGTLVGFVGVSARVRSVLWPVPGTADEGAGRRPDGEGRRELEEQSRARSEQLQQALHSRVIIEQAKGFLAGRDGISPADGFARLRRHARDNNLALREVARALMDREIALLPRLRRGP
ncbi:MAG: ANTAR domain-containing protein [Actinomycetes bacterium]